MADQIPSPQWLARTNRQSLIVRVLSGTIHDVNNALQVVGGSADLLSGSTNAEASAKRVAAIGTQSRRATALLADLTAFVRAVEGPVEAVDLVEMGERALLLRRHSLSRLQPAPVIDGEHIRVEASRQRVLQILLNLVVNAERALTAVPGGRLELIVGRDGEHGVFTVQDNGRGFPADRTDALFEPRLARDEAIEDLGIGLFVSRWLAARDQGLLTAALVPSGGASFTLRLPVSRR